MESAKEDVQDAGVEKTKRAEDATDATPKGLSAIFDRKPVEHRAALPQPAPVTDMWFEFCMLLTLLVEIEREKALSYFSIPFTCGSTLGGNVATSKISGMVWL
jgi:hypothetical protein